MTKLEAFKEIFSFYSYIYIYIYISMGLYEQNKKSDAKASDFGGGNWDRTNDLMHVKHTL